MDETLLQSAEQNVSAWLGTEEDGEGNNFSFEGRYWRGGDGDQNLCFYTQTKTVSLSTCWLQTWGSGMGQETEMPRS